MQSLKKHTFYILYAALSALLLASCATPIPVARLSPQAPEEAKRFWFGTEQVFLEQDSVLLTVAFLESSSSELVFCMEIINTSSKDILIEPEKAFLNILDSVSLKDKKVFAYNPEQKILSIDQRNSINEAEASNAATFNAVTSVINVAIDVSAVLSSDPNAIGSNSQQNYDNYQNEKLAYENRTISLSEERAYWVNNTIRKTHLPPNHSMKGTLIFPRYDAAKLLNWTFPIESMSFTLLYQQKLVRAQY